MNGKLNSKVSMVDQNIVKVPDRVKSFRLRDSKVPNLWSEQREVLVNNFRDAFSSVASLMVHIGENEDLFNDFFDEAKDRMLNGYVEYGSSIFKKSLGEIAAEQIEELVDAVIYSCIIKFIYKKVNDELAEED